MQQLLSALFGSNLTPNYWSQGTWAVLRVVIGLFMIHNGIDKLSDIESFANAYVEVIGLPFPIFFSYVAGYTELIAAPLVAVGLLTRPAALLNFATMAVAIYHHVLVAGFSVPYLELASIYAAAFLFFTVNGAGLFSLDAFVGNWVSDRVARNQTEIENILRHEVAESKN
jgi:putative oxidoreductase